MKRSKRDLFVFELDENSFIFNHESKTFESLESFDDISEDVWVLTDFNGTPPRFQWVETPPQYAEILAQRQLQEAGELEEGAHVIAHWKQVRGKTASQIFFTAIPGKAHLVHENRANELETHYLLFSCNALLLACLNHFTTLNHKNQPQKTLPHKKQKKQQQILAILFEHGRHVDLLVGRSGQVIGAGRVSSFANTHAAKESLAASVNAELRNIMEAIPNEISEIVHFNWLLPEPEMGHESPQEGHADWVAILAKQTRTTANIIAAQNYHLANGQLLLTSLPEVIQHLTDKDSTASPLELMAYRMQKFMPWTILVMLILVLCLGTTAFWLHVRNTESKAEVLALRNDTNTPMPTQIKPMDDSFKKVVTFVKNLEHWQHTPSFWMLLSELSSARVNKLFFDRVTIEYDENVKALVTLTGAIESSFQTANKDHEIFLAELTKHNFKVIKSSFATDVTQLTFEIKLERISE